ncbi:helix-turn-helix domain-containing protein [Neisseria sp. WLZKY-1]|jgi:hypothetical protein|uniref:helix-turn-helix domain-containing protein n=1 Tax=Neisseria sp. WLZKY-1 TaxID=3390377 RepID=UPI00397A916E
MSQNAESQVSQTPAEEFGKLLRERRESRELSLGEVAERLKLSAKQIEAFESGNYEHMRETVFVRGFLRTYGRFLDLDEQLVSSYLDKILPGTGVRSHIVEQGRQSSSLNFQNQKIGRPFPTWIFGVLAIAAIGFGVYVWQGKSREENTKQTATSEADVGLGQVAAPNVNAENISVLPMQNSASAAASGVQTAEPADAELVVKVRYRSMLVIKDKTGKELVNRVVPANSEHRFSGAAPYDVWIGYAKGAAVSYGSQNIAVADHMIDKKTAAFAAGK